MDWNIRRLDEYIKKKILQPIEGRNEINNFFKKRLVSKENIKKKIDFDSWEHSRDEKATHFIFCSTEPKPNLSLLP